MKLEKQIEKTIIKMKETNNPMEKMLIESKELNPLLIEYAKQKLNIKTQEKSELLEPSYKGVF